MPQFVAALPRELRAHAADPIAFESLRGKIVAVLGAGASAFDNAAVALEHGAAEVHLFCRRLRPQVVQPYRWLTFAGFLRHLSDLDDAWRWRFMSTILGMREGFPQETYDRCARHANFRLHTDAAWLAARVSGQRVELDTARGPFTADFLICGTGIDMGFELRPELRQFADNIATWADRYVPPDAERNDRLARYPYLAPDYAFTEKIDGTHALDPRRPPLRHRFDHELRALRIVDQRHDDGGGQVGDPASRVICSGPTSSATGSR